MMMWQYSMLQVVAPYTLVPILEPREMERGVGSWSFHELELGGTPIQRKLRTEEDDLEAQWR